MLHEKPEQPQIRANNTKHVTTHHNRAAKRTQHVGPNNAATCCAEMLRSFGQGFTGVPSSYLTALINGASKFIFTCVFKSFHELKKSISKRNHTMDRDQVLTFPRKTGASQDFS